MDGGHLRTNDRYGTSLLPLRPPALLRTAPPPVEPSEISPRADLAARRLRYRSPSVPAQAASRAPTHPPAKLENRAPVNWLQSGWPCWDPCEHRRIVT